MERDFVVSQSLNIVEQCLQERRARLQARIREQEITGVLISSPSLLYWLGNPKASLLLVTSEEVIPLEALDMDCFGRLGPATLGFDASLTAAQLLTLQGAAPQICWVAWGSELARLLAVKDEVELILLRRAAQITTQTFQRLGQRIEEGGCSELDLLSCAQDALLHANGSGFSFDPSIASGGSRTRLLWAGVTPRQLTDGDPVLIDLGAAFRGYQCDMTRFFFAGKRVAAADRTLLAACDAVEEALVEVKAAVRPGVQACTLHEICKQVLNRAGFDGTMQHHLGHGIGLNLHEFPSICLESSDVLLPGMVIALEPGVLLSTVGVRREDVILVTNDGCECLTGNAGEPITS